MKTNSPHRFLLPNLVTATSITFGFLAVQAAAAGKPYTAAWWVLYCVLTDKLDGAVARLVHASSNFGMHLDSLSDFLSFGVAPATVAYAVLSRVPELGWTEGSSLWALRLIAIFYTVCAAVRLARFNVVTTVQGADRFFFGMPSTLIGGTLCALFLAFLKYGDPAWIAGDLPPPWDPRPLGDVRLDAGLRYFPLLMLAGGVAMISTMRVPKLGRTRILPIDLWTLGNVAFAYTFGWARVCPEWLAFAALTYVLGALVYHRLAPAPGVKIPPLFG